MWVCFCAYTYTYRHTDIYISQGSLRLEKGCCLWRVTPIAQVKHHCPRSFFICFVLPLTPHLQLSLSHTDFSFSPDPCHCLPGKRQYSPSGPLPLIRNTDTLQAEQRNAAYSFIRIPTYTCPSDNEACLLPFGHLHVAILPWRCGQNRVVVKHRAMLTRLSVF